MQTERDQFIYDRFGRLRSRNSDTQFPCQQGFVDSTSQRATSERHVVVLKLRDDPSAVSMMVLPVLPEE